MQVLAIHLKERAAKRGLAHQPLIDHDAKGILVTGSTGMALDLFGSHVQRRSGWWLRLERGERALHHRDAKIAEQHLARGADEEILRFDIPMDHLLLMGVV